ncbi:hypothetical protein MKW92_033399, partial [Papaver armeniacum]
MSRTTMNGHKETTMKGYNKMIIKGYRELVSTPPSSCDLFSGKWVYDNSTKPFYSWEKCSFWND